MSTHLIRYRFTARSPIAHGMLGAMDEGNGTPHASGPALVDGMVVRIPWLTAGSIRGQLRRLLVRELLDRLAISRETCPGWDALYAALANGGTITDSVGRVHPTQIRAMREQHPLLALFGAALFGLGHQASAAKVSSAWLVCAESADGGLLRLHPEITAAASYDDLIAVESRVRLPDGDQQDIDATGVGPMPHTMETVITGSVFAGHARVSEDLLASAFAHGLSSIRYVGGKSAAGFGEVDVWHDGDPTAWRAYLDGVGEPERESLLAFAAALDESRAKKAAKKEAAAADKAAKKAAKKQAAASLFDESESELVEA